MTQALKKHNLLYECSCGKNFRFLLTSQQKVKYLPNSRPQGPGREVELSLPSAHDGWSMPCTHSFTPRKDPVPTVQKAGWAAVPVCMAWKISPPPQFNPWTVQSIANHYTDYAIMATYLTCVLYSNTYFFNGILT